MKRGFTILKARNRIVQMLRYMRDYHIELLSVAEIINGFEPGAKPYHAKLYTMG